MTRYCVICGKPIYYDLLTCEVCGDPLCSACYEEHGGYCSPEHFAEASRWARVDLMGEEFEIVHRAVHTQV